MKSNKPDKELDKLIDNLWGRALDMTSEDFADDADYLKAQKNYRNYSKKEIGTLLTQAHNSAIEEAIEAVDNSYELGITDIELAEYQGRDEPVLSKAELREELEGMKKK